MAAHPARSTHHRLDVYTQCMYNVCRSQPATREPRRFGGERRLAMVATLVVALILSPILAWFAVEETDLVARVGGWGRLGGGVEVYSVRKQKGTQTVTFHR